MALRIILGEDDAAQQPPPAASGGVFSNTEILEALSRHHIHIDPFNPAHLNTTSYDVTLGAFYWRTDRISNRAMLNPFEKDSVLQYFGRKAEKALTHRQWLKLHPEYRPFANIPMKTRIIVLEPGERILAHTQEFIGIDPPGTTSMQARSTLGRLGIQVCEDAGWGDAGFKNRWTMEIHNSNEQRKIVLPVGYRVAQIVFFKSGPVEGSYSRHTGKYQADSSLSSLKRNWSPEDMLPKSYLDKPGSQPPRDGHDG